MRRRALVPAVLALAAVGLTGCAPAVGATPTATPTPAVTFAGPHLVERNGRFLVVSNGENGDQADTAGRLGVDAEHCVTIGKLVLIAPKGSRLLADGSVVTDGRILKQGTLVNLGGSLYPEPVQADCGGERYWDANPR